METRKLMNVSRIVAWGAFWTSKSPQSTSKEPLEGSSGASWGLLGNFLGASWELSGLSWSAFGSPDASRTSEFGVKNHFDANLSTRALAQEVGRAPGRARGPSARAQARARNYQNACLVIPWPIICKGLCSWRPWNDECIDDRGLGSFVDLQELPKHLKGASWELLEDSSGASWGLLGSSRGSPGRLLVLQMPPGPQNLMSKPILMQI